MRNGGIDVIEAELIGIMGIIYSMELIIINKFHSFFFTEAPITSTPFSWYLQ